MAVRTGRGLLRRALPRLLPAVVTIAVASPAAAQTKPGWDRTANITDAAKRLVEMHKAQGSKGVIKFLDACYKTHTLASKFAAPLEACLAQDYMHGRVLVEIYGRVPEQARREMNAPDAGTIAASVSQRFASVMSQYGISEADALALRSSIESHGLPIFLKGVLPERQAGPAGGDQGRGQTEGKP